MPEDNDRTSVALTERARDRLRAAKIDGETYSDTVERLVSVAVGYDSGEKITVENVMNMPIRCGEHWLEPGETAEAWSEDNAVYGAIERGHVERVDR